MRWNRDLGALPSAKEALHILPESWEREAPEAVTEALLAFSGPLLRTLPRDHDVDDLKRLLRAASVCWNLPALECCAPDRHAILQRAFDQCLDRASEEIATCLLGLLRDRVVYFGWMPFAVTLELTGDTLETLEIHASPEHFARPAGRDPLAIACVSGTHALRLPGIPRDVKIRIA